MDVPVHKHFTKVNFIESIHEHVEEVDVPTHKHFTKVNFVENVHEHVQDVEVPTHRHVNKLNFIETIHEHVEDVEVAINKFVHRIRPVEKLVETFEDVEVIVEKHVQRARPVEVTRESTSEASESMGNAAIGGQTFSLGQRWGYRIDGRPRRTGNTNKDDLTLVEGIGPKINELLNNAGIWTFDELSYTSEDRLRKILEAAGNRFTMHNPETWPAQSALAAAAKWDELKVWQDELDGGRRK